MTPSTNPAKHSKTKLVVTLGPSTSTPEQIRQMVEAGASVFRINLSHGAGADHRRLAEAVRTGAEAAGSEQVAVMFDTRGPEIRTGELDSFELAAGDSVWLYPDSAGLPCKAAAIPAVPVTYSRISSLAEPSDQILLDDGLVVLEVVEISGDAVLCQAVNGGLVSSRRKVTPPRPAQDLSALTPEDRLDLELAVELEVDFVAASFVRGAGDVIAIRQFLEERGGSQAIIAKIENAAALDHISDILEAAEGLMVARGDLGVELPPEEVPILQKQLIKRARAAGKPVITATQMLESMIDNPRPTRAEASDVANAIFDGTDAVMLSGETAVGDYPLETVQMMERIAVRAEQNGTSYDHDGEVAEFQHHSVTDAISYASCTVARRLEAAAIISATQSGYTARMVSRHRPERIVVAATPDVRVSRRLALSWGVRPIIVPPRSSTDGMMQEAMQATLRAGLIEPGDMVVGTAGLPVGTPGTTNMLQVQTVGEILVKGTGIGTESYTGRARVLADMEEAASLTMERGDILIANTTDRELTPLLEKAGALVAERGGLTSHAAIAGLNFGIPTIVGANGATTEIDDGAIITVDAASGLVYAGRATVS